MPKGRLLPNRTRRAERSAFGADIFLVTGALALGTSAYFFISEAQKMTGCCICPDHTWRFVRLPDLILNSLGALTEGPDSLFETGRRHMAPIFSCLAIRLLSRFDSGVRRAGWPLLRALFGGQALVWPQCRREPSRTTQRGNTEIGCPGSLLASLF